MVGRGSGLGVREGGPPFLPFFALFAFFARVALGLGGVVPGSRLPLRLCVFLSAVALAKVDARDALGSGGVIPGFLGVFAPSCPP